MSARRLVITAALALLAPLAARTAEAQRVSLGDSSARLQIDPDPPQAGENRLTVTLTTASGQPVDGAKVAFVWDMPAMGAMPEMKGTGTVTAKGSGGYLISYPLTMNGDWYLTLAIEAPGHPRQEVKMKIATGRPGLSIEQAEAGDMGTGIRVSLDRQQLIGVRFASVEPRPLALTLRAAGRVAVDERNVGDVTLKYEAYVQKVLVGETGKTVRRGQPLAIVYSPDLRSAEEELLAARRAGASGPLASGPRAAPRLLGPVARADSGAGEGRHGRRAGDHLLAGGRRRPGEERRRGRPRRSRNDPLPRGEPRTGLGPIRHRGARRRPGLGRPAGARPPGRRLRPARRARHLRRPHRRREDPDHRRAPGAGQPAAGAQARDVRRRGHRRPARRAPDGPRLRVAALRRAPLCLRRSGGGRLEPVEVQVGALGGDYDEVRAGLSPGDRVATGATFLLSSEAKLRDALPRWKSP